MGIKIIADLHTHTLASTHAYNTVHEMVSAAGKKGLSAIAITDHAKLMPGAPGPWYFGNLRQIPLYYMDVMTIVGIEGNIVDFDGNMDIDPDDVGKLDWIIASIHNIGLQGLQDPSVEKCTELWLKIAENPDVNVIAHSGSPKYKYDYEKVIPVFGEKHKLVEINSHSFDVRRENIPNCIDIAKTCKKYGVPIVVNSDAHFETEVGRLDSAIEMLESIDFPEELVVNATEKSLNDYLEKHTKIFSNRQGRA